MGIYLLATKLLQDNNNMATQAPPIQIPNIYTIIAEATAAIESIPGLADLDVDPSSPTGQLINVLSNLLLQLYLLLGGVYSASRVSQAQQQALRELLALLNVYDQGGTQTIIPGVTLTGANTTVIAAGSLAQDSVGNLFYSANDVTISGTTATVDFYAQNNGAIVVAVGALNVIATPIAGWTAVNNTLAGVTGQASLPDSYLRQLHANLTNQFSLGYIGAVEAAIYQNPAVLDINTIENDTGTDAPGPTNVPAHSFLFIIHYNDTTQEQAIAESIFRAKGAPGTFSNTDGTEVSKTVTDISGNPHTITWNKATQVPIYIIVNIAEDSEVSIDSQDVITQALLDYVNGNIANDVLAAARIGGKLIYSRLLACIANIDPNVNVETFFIGTAPTPTGTSDLSALFTQIFTLSDTNITVNII